jgi:hypothetical protein
MKKYNDQAVESRIAADKRQHVEKTSGHVKRTANAKDKSKGRASKPGIMGQAAMNVYLQRRGLG